MSECSDADSSVAIRALDDVDPCLGPSFSAMGKASSASVSGRLGRRDLSFRVSSLRKCLGWLSASTACACFSQNLEATFTAHDVCSEIDFTLRLVGPNGAQKGPRGGQDGQNIEN